MYKKIGGEKWLNYWIRDKFCPANHFAHVDNQYGNSRQLYCNYLRNATRNQPYLFIKVGGRQIDHSVPTAIQGVSARHQAAQ